MTARRSVRDRWIDEVLRTDAVGLSCKLVLIALSRDMTESGRAEASRETLAERVGLQSVTRVSDRLAEARKAQLLDRVGGGYAGQPTIWQAMIPPRKLPRSGVPSGAEGYGSRGTFFGVPFPTPAAIPECGKVPRHGVAMTRAGARAPSRTRSSRPAPDGSRAFRPQSLRNSSSNGERATPVLLVAADPSVRTTRPQPALALAAAA